MPAIQIDLAQAVTMYQAEHSLKEIAALEGTSPQTVGRRLVEAGIQLRGKAKTARHRAKFAAARLKPLDATQLRDLAGQGMTTEEIGAKLGCSAECIRERMVKLGIPRLGAQVPASPRAAPKYRGGAKMERNYFWRGGRSVDKHGYVRVKSPDHPHRTKAGYVREHRLVMEAVLGRYLEPGEVVHHIDGDPAHNDPANLQLFAANGRHLAATIAGQVPRWSAETQAFLRECLQRGRDKLAAIHAASKNDDPRQR